MIHLSKRLAAVAALVGENKRLLDVGTDHGYIPIALVLEGRVPSALACDINEGPLAKAKENIEKYKLDTKISTRLSDGLKNVAAGEADSIVIAGMGGLLMEDILEFGRAHGRLDSVSELILQPQSDIWQVRHWLHHHGWMIDKEDMVLDAGKYYMMMRAVRGTQKYEHEYEYIYGKCLICDRHPVLIEYLTRHLSIRKNRYEQLCGTDSQGALDYIPHLLEEISMIETVLNLMENSEV